MVSLQQLLKAMVESRASDLHICAGSPPQLRIDGTLVKVEGQPLSAEATKTLCYSALTEARRAKFEEQGEIDLSFGIEGLARFRANLFMQRGAVGGAFRLIPFRIPSFHELGLPAITEEMCKKPQGLVLATGPTGSGKSSTLAAMLDKINQDDKGHILTVEDPIEFLHVHKNSIVNQREVGTDTQSFKTALKYILRQDPDVVLIGELRDLETLEAALTVAETGHLVLASLHTNSAVESIHRIVDVFPAHQQAQVRLQLSMCLEGIFSQRLLPRMGGGRALAIEVLVPTPAVRNLIRENKIHQIYSQMQLGQARNDMQTLNQSLCSLYLRRQISMTDALANSPEPDELQKMLQGGNPSVARPHPGGIGSQGK